MDGSKCGVCSVRDEYDRYNHDSCYQSQPLVEITRTMHEKYYSTIHMFSKDKSFRSGIDRTKHDTFRENYWKNRAKDFEEFMKNAK